MDELVEFYGRYITAFNAGDRAAFAEFFHLPLTVLHAARYDERRAGRALAVITDPSRLWAPLPGHWERTTIDEVLPVAAAAPFSARHGLTERGTRRPGLFATVTRWSADGAPYEQIHVLYLLTGEDCQLGIKVMVELGVADRPLADDAG